MKTMAEFGKLASPLIYKVKNESASTKLKLSESVKNIYTDLPINFLNFKIGPRGVLGGVKFLKLQL
jgi:hypothetical protein